MKKRGKPHLAYVVGTSFLSLSGSHSSDLQSKLGLPHVVTCNQSKN
jgi:hypothetical protein